jgi:hypothetical protein
MLLIACEHKVRSDSASVCKYLIGSTQLGYGGLSLMSNSGLTDFLLIVVGRRLRSSRCPVEKLRTPAAWFRPELFPRESLNEL